MPILRLTSLNKPHFKGKTSAGGGGGGACSGVVGPGRHNAGPVRRQGTERQAMLLT